MGRLKLPSQSARFTMPALLAVLLTLLCCILVGLAAASEPAAARALHMRSAVESPGQAAFAPGEVLVKLRQNGADPGPALALGYPVAVKGSVDGLGVLRLQVPVGRELETVHRLQEIPLIEWAEPDYLRGTMDTVPNDQLYRQFQWNLRKIQAEQAWDITTGSSDLLVAVLDTGIDRAHPDLAGKLVAGYDFLNDNPEPVDDSGHGTHKAGVVAAASNNGMGVAGVAWGARVMPIKVLNSSNVGPDSAIARGITYSVDHGAKIINMSFGSSTTSKVLASAVAYALGKGALLVAAAGNTAKLDNATIYPAAYEGVMAVAATDEADKVADFSQHHPYVGISAPGVRIVSTFWRGAGYGSYVSSSGTSDAAPHVSGLAALIWSVSPGLTNLQVKKLIEDTSDDLGTPGKDEYYGAGRINAYRALRAARPSAGPAATVPPMPSLPAPAPGPVATPASVPRTIWYFPQASATGPFDLWLLLQNPNAAAAAAKVTYVKGDGAQQVQEVSLPPLSRRSIFVNQVVPNAEVSMKVESDSLVFAERALYFGTGGRTSTGVAAPSSRWYLAEGSTRRGFDSWILLQNPMEVPANVTLTFLTSEGQRKETGVGMAAASRQGIHVNELVPDAEVSTLVVSDQPILAERATYFGGTGGHGSMGERQLARSWYLAEGRVGDGFDTWLLVLNPNSSTANLRVTYMREDGTTPVAYYAVAPGSRFSLYVNDAVPSGPLGARVESDQPVVVDRSTYFAGGRGGDSVTATSLLSLEWYLPEGCTNPPFTETIAVLNPGDQVANLAVTFMKEDGVSEVRYFAVNPTSRLTLNVNDLMPNAEFSTKVMADVPIAVERSLYFANGQGGTSSFGIPR